ncbi:MAG: hypothetical protein Kow00133_05880 [Amphiplicatus sp.]
MMSDEDLRKPLVRRLFATPVIEAMLPDAPARNAALLDAIRARKAASPGITRSNVNGWHSDSQMLSWGGPAAKAVALDTLRLCGRYTTDIGMRNNQPRYEMSIEMWANVSPPGASNQNHAHAGALWSAVYYVDDGGDPEGGALTLLDPRFPMSRMYAPDLQFADEDGAREENIVKIRPVPGKVVMFPAWLMHGVQPHNGARERVSIAMNIMAIPARPPTG